MGLQVTLTGFLATLVLIALIGLAIAPCSYAFALILKSEDGLAPTLNFFMIPLQLLSGITLPLTLAPLWIQRVALANPLTHAVNAARALFNSNFSDSSIITRTL